MSVELPLLLDALRASWCGYTCQLFREQWEASNAARGQCCVSSLVVRDYYGGHILRGYTNLWTVHYWNELPDGTWLDTTHSQFGDDEYIVNWAQRYPDSLWRFNETAEKHAVLAARVALYIEKAREQKADDMQVAA